MSGLVVGFGNPDAKAIETMMNKIEHRGPDLSGTFQRDRVLMAQNYLKADVDPEKTDISIPLAVSSGGIPCICYDGQMGNAPELARDNGLGDGPFREERIVLSLYERYGVDAASRLTDAVFAFVISDGDKLFAARDLLGIKTLFYGWKHGTLYLATELKSIVQVTDDFYEFPAGHYMDEPGSFTRFAELPEVQPKVVNDDVDRAVKDIRAIIRKSFRNRIDFSHPTASLLSGGIDSSVIACVATEAYREKFGPDARLTTFALGVGESNDIKNARLVSKRLGTDHHELIVSLDDILAVLPDVIYQLESFDPSLVRSSASNYLISRYARENGFEILLSGEGGDEVFCGYIYLKEHPLEEMHTHQMRCIGFLHNNASLRLDRMNHCNSVRVVAPLISGELLNYSLGMPPEFKQKPENGEKIEKWIFRKAFESDLPEQVVWRLKQEFSQGSGSADVLPNHFEQSVSDDDLKQAQAAYPMIRSKEELYYFRIFTGHFGTGKAIDTVGQWVCI